MRIGITGGIGSGKSTVCKIFETLGIPVFYADDVAKEMYYRPDIAAQVKQLFGEGIYIGERVNYQAIAKHIFAKEALKNTLSSIIHPAVKEAYQDWEKMQKAPYTLREAAILIESGAYKDCDKIIVVTAPEGLRIQRVMERDAVEKNTVEARIKAQMPEEERLKYADFIIRNDGESLLIPQVLQIHQQFIKR